MGPTLSCHVTIPKPGLRFEPKWGPNARGCYHYTENPGLFGPIPVRSGRFGPGRFGPISEVSRFGPVGAGRFGPIS